MGGVIFDIQRCSMHDGPGIRTTVFLKGCPLKCLWCHNPESQDFAPELALFLDRCTLCRACDRVCPVGAHRFVDGVHALNRGLCALCGRCTKACPTSALKQYGETMNADRVIDIAMKDAAYYKETGGGLTVSGGEPFAQPDFLLQILENAKRRSMHTCVETSGYARWADILRALPYIDLFLFDIKAIPEDHKKLTSVDNGRILSNLDQLMALGARVTLRCPVVPGVSDTSEYFRFLAALEKRYSALQGVEILPYHDMGRGKARSLGREYIVSARTTDEADKKDWKAKMRAAGLSTSAINSF